QSLVMGGLKGAGSAATSAMRRSTPIGFVRDVLANALDALSSLTAWPAAVIVTVRVLLKTRHVPSRVADIRRYLGGSLALQESVASLAFMLPVTLSVALVGVHQYLIVAAEAAILANMGRQLATTLRPATLIQGLRLSLRSPALQLALIALADFVCLVLAA